jgi:CelD/BcsL family acetyltransferase involved in cellulose biosynthesis
MNSTHVHAESLSCSAPSHDVNVQPEPQGRIIEATLEDFDGLRDEWGVLASVGRAAEPFFQPYWFRAFAQTFNSGRPSPTVVVRKGARLVGILPLMRRQAFFGKMPARVLRSLSGVHSCRYDFVCDSDDDDSVSLAAWKALRADRTWGVIEALGVPEDGAFAGIMRHAENDGYLTAHWSTLLSPYLAIPSDGHDPFANSPQRHRKDRKKLDKYQARLQEFGPIKFEVFNDYRPDFFERFVEMEGAGWKGERGGAIKCSSVTLSFYRELLPLAAAQGHVRLSTLKVADNPVSMELSFVIGDRCFSPKVTYDEAFSRCAPGQLLARETIREVARRGCHRYDLLGPRARYKTIWAGDVRRHSHCYIFRPSLIGAAYRSGVRDVAPVLRNIKHRICGDPQAQG